MKNIPESSKWLKEKHMWDILLIIALPNPKQVKEGMKIGAYAYGHERFICLYRDFATPWTTACASLKSCQVFRPDRRWSATSVNWDWRLLKSSFLSIASLACVFGDEQIINQDWEKWKANKLYSVLDHLDVINECSRVIQPKDYVLYLQCRWTQTSISTFPWNKQILFMWNTHTMV